MKFRHLIEQRGYLTILLCLILALTVGCSSSSNDNDDDDTTPPPSGDLFEPTESQAVVYYKRLDGNYEGWGLHLWDAAGADFAGDSVGIEWPSPLLHTGISEKYGAYYVVDFASGDWTQFNFIVHKGDDKDLGGLDHTFVKADMGSDLFSFEGNATLFPDPLETPPVALEGTKAHWVGANLIAYSGSGNIALHHSATADISVDSTTGTASGGNAIALTAAGDSDAVNAARAMFPHLSSLSMWSIPAETDVKSILKEQLVVTAATDDGALLGATKVQTRGALDDIYADAAKDVALGAVTDGTTTFSVWAPTAQNVEVMIYDADKNLLSTNAMTEDAATGVWSFASAADESGNFYQYSVTVYHYLLDSVQTFVTTDPYSLSLSTNSVYSQVVDMDDPALKPAGWDEAANDTSFVVENPEDIIVYETHVRDFSIYDENGTAAYDGKFMAYTEAERDSVAHLQALRDAGLTHVHLLPAFDIATINEFTDMRADLTSTKGEFCALNANADICSSDVDDTTTLQEVMESYDPAGSDAQALMNDLRGYDSFNWGYDPFHYTAPEGSYATDPEGSTRILEFREMVMSLQAMGFNVVMDVVYNHTNASGNSEKSVLDKIVPGYYHRLNVDSGAVEKSTCCDNTSTESKMFQKLTEDSLIVWARDYRVDSFRFDLMGHHPKQGIMDALAAVQEVRSHVYFYGEGWNFGEVANDAQFEQATQLNMAGTSVGTFTDRLRDAVRGGGPFDSENQLRENQGFANGLFTQPNELSDSSDDTKATLLALTDNIRVGMAGNLENFVLVNASGDPALGYQYDYNGQPTGYAKDPADTINYVSKHDNQTLWDNNQYKIADGVSTEDRVRMQLVGMSIPLMSQGIPFLHMGAEILRSKSMQRDSFDSGDWFNKVDFTYMTNNWNVGLPREDKDGGNWPVISGIIDEADAAPMSSDIVFANSVFLDLLSIRTGSELFRLTTADDVNDRVDFRNTGPDQIPGLIAMTIDDGTGLTDLDPNIDAIVVVVNASASAQTVAISGASGFELHATQATGADAVVMGASVSGSDFTVPALTTAVFVKPQAGAQGAGLPVSAKDLSAIPPYGTTAVYLRGSMNGWGTGNEMAFQGSGVYATTLTLDAGSYEFKVAEAGWADPNLGADSAVVIGEPLALVPGGGGNIGLTLDANSVVTFSLNASNTDAPVLTVTAEGLSTCSALADSSEASAFEASIYLRGEGLAGGWDSAEDVNELTYKGNNQYQAVVTFDSAISTPFKIANADWGTQFTARDGTTVISSDLALNVEYTAVAGDSGFSNNAISLDPGTYSFLLTTTGPDADGTLLVCEVQ